ncbi:MAG TPA: type III pantothenate kinase [Acholeplasmataceae bacterium]|nr:type III pantothenate kinase [Acholeplasmataceae bacterium]
MILCIDIGNTNIVTGLLDDNRKLLGSFRIHTNAQQTADEYGVKLVEIFRFYGYDYQLLSGVIIASVVPELDHVFEQTIKKYLGITPLFVGPGIKTGIKVKIDQPRQLGADILVGIVGGYAKYGAPLLVIDMGTAIKFFYLNEDKELLGGIIAPGISTSFDSLVSKASKLEGVKIDVPPHIIGRDTATSIQSAMIHGTAAMIDGIIKKIRKEMNVDFRIVITGGEARIITPFLEEKVTYDENLILDGLIELYAKNKS